MEEIIVAFSGTEAQRRIVQLLHAGGYPCAGSYCAGADVIRAVRQLGGAVVVCGFRLRDMTASRLAADLQDAALLLTLSSAANLDFCQGENLYKLPTPASPDAIFASLELLTQRRSGRPCRPAFPRRREEEQRLIDRAKALLMDVNRMSEAEAHRFLQKKSMDSGLRMTQAAQLILQAYGR